MSDKKNEGRLNIEDLPQAEQELTAQQAKEVKGGTEIPGPPGGRGATVTIDFCKNNTYTGSTNING